MDFSPDIKLLYLLRLLNKKIFTELRALDTDIVMRFNYYADKFNWQWNEIYLVDFMQRIVDELRK